MMLSATRGLLDQCLRRQVLVHPGITLLTRTTALDLRSGPGAGDHAVRVGRVRVSADGDECDMAAGLVVDATGRASRTPV